MTKLINLAASVVKSVIFESDSDSVEIRENSESRLQFILRLYVVDWRIMDYTAHQRMKGSYAIAAALSPDITRTHLMCI